MNFNLGFLHNLLAKKVNKYVEQNPNRGLSKIGLDDEQSLPKVKFKLKPWDDKSILQLGQTEGSKQSSTVDADSQGDRDNQDQSSRRPLLNALAYGLSNMSQDNDDKGQMVGGLWFPSQHKSAVGVLSNVAKGATNYAEAKEQQQDQLKKQLLIAQLKQNMANNKPLTAVQQSQIEKNQALTKKANQSIEQSQAKLDQDLATTAGAVSSATNGLYRYLCGMKVIPASYFGGGMLNKGGRTVKDHLNSKISEAVNNVKQIKAGEYANAIPAGVRGNMMVEKLAQESLFNPAVSKKNNILNNINIYQKIYELANANEAIRNKYSNQLQQLAQTLELAKKYANTLPN